MTVTERGLKEKGADMRQLDFLKKPEHVQDALKELQNNLGLEPWLEFITGFETPRQLAIEDKKPASFEAIEYLQDAYDAMTRCAESITKIAVQVHQLPKKHQTATVTDTLGKALQSKNHMQKDLEKMSDTLMSPPAGYSTKHVKEVLKKSSGNFSFLLTVEKDRVASTSYVETSS